MTYRYLVVGVKEVNKGAYIAYNGDDAADAMAALNTIIETGSKYAILEAVRQEHVCRSGCEHDPGDGVDPVTGYVANH